MADTVWIVAQVKSFDAEGWAADWDLGGVFTTEDGARSACAAQTDAIWPVVLDQPLGTDTTEPPGILYPLAPAGEV